jgi:hypothetical protein
MVGGAAAGGADEAATAVSYHCRMLRYLPMPEALFAILLSSARRSLGKVRA